MRTFAPTLAIALLVTLIVNTATAQPPGGRNPRDGRHPMHPLVQTLDLDNDGLISAEEMKKAGDTLKGLDKNKDGKLAGQEIGRPQRPSRGPADDETAKSSPVPKDDAEKKILAVLDDMDKNQRRGMMNVPTEDGRLLRLLAEMTDAKQVVEIGTSSGYSGIWFCLGLRKTGGKLTTYEIDAGRAELARKNFKRAGVEKFITLVEGNAHDEIGKLKGPIDIIFLDADKEGYVDYLKKLLPLLRPGGLIIAHNTSSHRGGMEDYLKAVTTNGDLETLFLNMHSAGLGVSLKKR